MAGVNAAGSLTAIRADTAELLSIADPPETLRALSDARLLRCPQCGGGLVYKAGNVRLHHFAHVAIADCTWADHEPESEMHRLGKFTLFQHFRRGASDAALERHLPATDQRADCFIAAPDGTPYALEFQQANNTAERWLERHALYRSQGIHDIWLLGAIRYQENRAQPPRPISAYEPIPIPRDQYDGASGIFRVREMEKAILSVDDRLIYLDPETGMMVILISRSYSANTLRAYRFRVPLAEAKLREGRLWTPLDPLLEPYFKMRKKS